MNWHLCKKAIYFLDSHFLLVSLNNLYTKCKIPEVQTWIQMSQGNGLCCSTTNKYWKSPLYLWLNHLPVVDPEISLLFEQ